MTKKEILSITSPTKLFGEKSVKVDYRLLVHRWHPDKPDGDEEVFKHISKLYKQALIRIEAGTWNEDVDIAKYVDSKTGKTYKIRYKRKHIFELGTMFINSRTIIYAIAPKFKSLVENAVNKIGDIKFGSNPKMQLFDKQIAKPKQVVYTDDIILVIFDKSPDYILLKDIQDHYKTMPARHVAWILSRLYSFTCFLEYNKLSHNALGPDSIFINPKEHSILVSSWWYASEIGVKLLGLPKRTVLVCNDSDKTSNHVRDIELIRLTARELFNDQFGRNLISNPDVPNAFALWSTISSGIEKPLDEYEAYEKILALSWGKKQFVNMPITENMIYKDK